MMTRSRAGLIEAGRLLFARPAEFMLSVVAFDSLPAPDPARDMFCGPL